MDCKFFTIYDPNIFSETHSIGEILDSAREFVMSKTKILKNEVRIKLI
jgi:hypothetical protein